MSALWIVLTVLIAAVGGWPVTAGVLRLAKTADVREASSVRDQPAPERVPSSVPIRRTPVSGPETALDTMPDTGLETMPEPVRTGTSELTNPTVLRGGLVIGVLERSAIVLAILADQSVAIAYVVAIKGLGRYPELKQTPAASERFIIGTLTSMLWAAGLATLAKWLLLG